MVSVLGCALFLAAASPSGPVALIVSPEGEHEGTRWVEAEDLVAAELAALGYRVVRSEARGAHEDRALGLVAAAQEHQAVAVLQLERQAHVVLIDVWVSSQQTAKFRQRTVERAVDGREQTPAVLAMRAVETLQAARLEVGLEEPYVQPAVSAQSAEPPRQEATTTNAPSGQGSIRAGIAGMYFPGAAGLLLGPSASVAYAPRGSFRVSATLAAGIVGERVERGDASATLDAIVAEVRAGYVLSAGARFRFPLALSAGLLRFSAHGHASKPAQVRDVSAAAGTFGGVGGVELALGGGLGLALEVGVKGVSPQLEVFLREQRSALVGPLLLDTHLAVSWGAPQS